MKVQKGLLTCLRSHTIKCQSQNLDSGLLIPGPAVLTLLCWKAPRSGAKKLSANTCGCPCFCPHSIVGVADPSSGSDPGLAKRVFYPPGLRASSGSDM